MFLSVLSLPLHLKRNARLAHIRPLRKWRFKEVNKVTSPTAHREGSWNASPRHSDTGTGWGQEPSKRVATLHRETLRHRAATCLTSHG